MTSSFRRPSAAGQVLVTGSLAFDQIMDFPGFFKDHILPEKIHMISISFLVSDFRKQRGGCAGNIAYTLALLGERPRILATAGNDFAEYRDWLIEQGVDVSSVEEIEDRVTASCFITTDKADNQITGFYIGAMEKARDLSLVRAAGNGPAPPRYAVVAPDDPEAMLRHCREGREAGLPVIFDPSFQVIALEGEPLAEAARGAKAVVVNDYEYAVFQEKTGRDAEGLLELAEMWVVTYGEEGSEVLLRGGDKVKIPAAEAKEVVDPTGAGDAYRGGFVAGLMRGADLGVCGRMGSVAAVYVVEKYGTQSHHYSGDEFWRRYQENFGD
jgi:adenosine kinase